MDATFARLPAKAVTAKLSSTDWAVLHVIALHADKNGKAFPSLARIGVMTGMKRKNVPRTIKRLTERGLLRVARPQRGSVNVYQLIFEPVEGVLNTEDTSPEHVLNHEDTYTKGCPQMADHGVLTGEALTDQGTDLSQVSEVGGYREVNGRPVLNTEDTLCDWYITNDHGYRICRKPTYGARYCPEHAAAAR